MDMARVLSEADVRDLLRDKHVAIVGNAASGLTLRHGAKVDACDLVIRLNAGIPGPEHYEAIGRRTDVLSTGTYVCWKASMRSAKEPLRQLWLCKPEKSRIGKRDWGRLMSEQKVPMWRIPQPMFESIWNPLGTPPSGGLMVIEIARAFGAKRLDLFGFDFFSGETWWWKQRPRAVYEKMLTVPRPHDGANERRWLDARGLEQEEEGWFSIKN